MTAFVIGSASRGNRTCVYLLVGHHRRGFVNSFVARVTEKVRNILPYLVNGKNTFAARGVALRVGAPNPCSPTPTTQSVGVNGQVVEYHTRNFDIVLRISLRATFKQP